EPLLRLFVVTPAQHVIHHSVDRRETNSNFGFNLPWWDWLFGTYTAEPRKGYDGMTIGLEDFREAREQRIDRLLTQPFRNSEDKPA
ncbi:MAG: sterol desaturase family protein, partial [Beijerinckiaceae bacterium]